MKGYLAEWQFKTGLALLLLGNGPLVGIIVLAKIGIWPDPDPNPIGAGMLSFVTFWPAVILLGAGVRRARAKHWN